MLCDALKGFFGFLYPELMYVCLAVLWRIDTRLWALTVLGTSSKCFGHIHVSFLASILHQTYSAPPLQSARLALRICESIRKNSLPYQILPATVERLQTAKTSRQFIIQLNLHTSFRTRIRIGKLEGYRIMSTYQGQHTPAISITMIQIKSRNPPLNPLPPSNQSFLKEPSPTTVPPSPEH